MKAPNGFMQKEKNNYSKSYKKKADYKIRKSLSRSERINLKTKKKKLVWNNLIMIVTI
jgi:hypothetical protein